ncbi:hypothetical protein [Ruminococcus sp. FC2018]|uniref:hypothetical protein n=1 Tax=Ruminococcus sp. FC2018 TaxID=1410617 RepID=UPI00048C3AF7|nr:hypothetical protein [Ruminococcus sp. FC2018]
MEINTDNAIVKFSAKGKPFPYDKLFYETVNKYILEYKNARLDKLTEKDASICLARIIRKMEVNDVPVQQFFKQELDSWIDESNYQRVLKLVDLMAKDIFCCFDKNRDLPNGDFCRTDRIYCVNNDGERDYIVCNDMHKQGMFKKVPTAYTLYFNELMERNKRGMLPKSK